MVVFKNTCVALELILYEIILKHQINGYGVLLEEKEFPNNEKQTKRVNPLKNVFLKFVISIGGLYTKWQQRSHKEDKEIFTACRATQVFRNTPSFFQAKTNF